MTGQRCGEAKAPEARQAEQKQVRAESFEPPVEWRPPNSRSGGCLLLVRVGAVGVAGGAPSCRGSCR